MAEKVSTSQAANADKKKAFALNGFPASDFDDSLQIPKLIMERGGGVADLDQLAAWLGYTTSASGTFASRLASARYFGLIGPAKGGKVYITERARQIVAPVMPEDAIKAKMEAFLNVPLFKRVFERVRGATLPQDIGLRNLFSHEFQVPSAKTALAVRLFKDSARQTGFYDAAPDRLIRPSFVASPAVAPAAPAGPVPAQDRDGDPQPPPVRRFAGGGGDGPSSVHPAIVGLIRELGEKGPTWNEVGQKGFLDALTGLVKFIYPAKGEADGA
jgi:hypothetical protein